MDDLDRLVRAVESSPKYRFVEGQVVRRIGSRELLSGRGWKEAVKETKRKLHQAGAAYLEGSIDYGAWLGRLQAAAASPDPNALRRVCEQAMQLQSSTRERLPILPQFYAETLGRLPRIRTVVDLACGLNPLAIPWMPLGSDAQYYAFDMYKDMAAFLHAFLSVVGIRGEARAVDVLDLRLNQRADVALILKSLPSLEELDRAAAGRLLEGLNAEHLLVSFPVRSLGGRNKGMLRNYEVHFRDLVRGRPWSVQRFEFATELAFLVSR